MKKCRLLFSLLAVIWSCSSVTPDEEIIQLIKEAGRKKAVSLRYARLKKNYPVLHKLQLLVRRKGPLKTLIAAAAALQEESPHIRAAAVGLLYRYVRHLLRHNDPIIQKNAARILYRCSGKYINFMLDECKKRLQEGTLKEPFTSALRYAFNRDETIKQQNRRLSLLKILKHQAKKKQ